MLKAADFSDELQRRSSHFFFANRRIEVKKGLYVPAHARHPPKNTFVSRRTFPLSHARASEYLTTILRKDGASNGKAQRTPEIRAQSGQKGRTLHARDEARQTEIRALRKKGQKPQAGDRDRPLRGSQIGSEGPQAEETLAAARARTWRCSSQTNVSSGEKKTAIRENRRLTMLLSSSLNST